MMHSFKKKLTTLAKEGTDPVYEGMHNFNKPDAEIEALALERSKTCETCPLFVKEPVCFLAIKDERIPILSKMMCDDCGCTLPYKTRQTQTKCDKWLR
jgi:hypothetical protein